MATELDHDVIKQKIVAILQANTSLFTTTAETGELRSIEVGFPQGGELVDKMPPYAYVTDAVPFETAEYIGSVSSGQITAINHIFDYEIAVIVNEKDSRKAEVELDEFQKLILETLEADFDLTGTGSADVDSSKFATSNELRINPADRGRGYKGRSIKWRCSKITAGATGSLLGQIGELILNDKLTLEEGSSKYLSFKLKGLKIGRPEKRTASNDSGPSYSTGGGDNFFMGTIMATTPELSTFNTRSQDDSNGELTETLYKIVAEDVSGATRTFATTGYLRDYMMYEGPGKHVMVDIFVRITGDTVAVT